MHNYIPELISMYDQSAPSHALKFIWVVQHHYFFKVDKENKTFVDDS